MLSLNDYMRDILSFCLISTHYSLDQNYRNRMTDEIIASAKTFDKPIYLAGDLNEWPHNESIKKFMIIRNCT